MNKSLLYTEPSQSFIVKEKAYFIVWFNKENILVNDVRFTSAVWKTIYSYSSVLTSQRQLNHEKQAEELMWVYQFHL